MNSSSRQATTLTNVVAAVLLSVAPAIAQDTKPVSFNIGVGAIMPEGDVADRFDTGVTVPLGLTFNISDNVGLQGEYAYSWMGGPDGTVTPVGGQPTLLESNHSMHMGSANLVLTPSRTSRVGGYLIGGIGVYHRSVELTTPAVGLATICDPWFFVCYPTPVAIDQVVGSRSTTDVGFNIGAAITFAQHFYIEARYHYVAGPEFTVGSTNVKATGHYFPIVAGFRF
jgi:opacity protein-like surface antigen